MKIAITTSGGDAPGLNAVVYSTTIAARRCGQEMVPLSFVAGKNNLVSASSPELRTAANPGICFGI